MDDALTIVRLHDADTPEFEQLVVLYTEAFPASERKPVETLRRMIARSTSHFLLVWAERTIVGFAIVMWLESSPVALLEYMAVTPEARGTGVGRRLFREILHAAEDAGCFLLMELESDAVDSPDLAQRSRRKRFYRSLGTLEIHGLAYRMPPVSREPPPPMHLMVCASALPEAIPRETLRRWLGSVYREVYGQNAEETRVRVDAMLAALPEAVPLV